MEHRRSTTRCARQYSRVSFSIFNDIAEERCESAAIHRKWFFRERGCSSINHAANFGPMEMWYWIFPEQCSVCTECIRSKCYSIRLWKYSENDVDEWRRKKKTERKTPRIWWRTSHKVAWIYVLFLAGWRRSTTPFHSTQPLLCLIFQRTRIR